MTSTPKKITIDLPHRIDFFLAIPFQMSLSKQEESCVYKVREYPTIRKTCGVKISFAERRGESEAKFVPYHHREEKSMPDTTMPDCHLCGGTRYC
jgi:hypothetical protein